MAITYDPEHLTYLQALRNLKAQGRLDYKSFSNDWVVKFWQGDNVHFMLSRVPDVNTQVAGEIATDKVGTYLLLSDAGLQAVPHSLLSTPATPEIDQALLRSLFLQYGSLVIKPTHGSMGRDVARCDSLESAMSHMNAHKASVSSWSASPYIEVASEMRLAVFDGVVELVYKKTDPPVINGLRMFNLNLGAQATSVELASLDPAVKLLATQSMHAIGLRLGAVDIIFHADGSFQVLEINSRFSIEHFADLSPTHHSQAIAFYERLLESALASR